MVKSFVSVGEAMIELRSKDEFSLSTGVAGDTLNTTVYLKRLRPTWSAQYATGLGQDRLSKKIVQFLERESLETQLVRYDINRSCGLYLIDTNDVGERSFSYWRRGSAATAVFDTPWPAFASAASTADCLYLSAISVAILSSDAARMALLDSMRRARQAGSLVAFDTNYRPVLWEDQKAAQYWIPLMSETADIVFVSRDDDKGLFLGAEPYNVGDRYNLRVNSSIVSRHGPENIHIITRTSEPQTIPIELVPNPVDTTGAGDAFNAGFLATYIETKETLAAVHAGHALARKVVMASGAIFDL